MRAFSILLFCALISLPIKAQFDFDHFSSEMDNYLSSIANDSEPGLAVGVVHNGLVVYEHYEGLANMEHSVPVSENTIFNIASVAKQFTALAVLTAVDSGWLALEDDIREYLPAFLPNIKEEILIRHLLNHSSGIRDVYDLLSIKRDPWWRKEGFDNSDAYEILLSQEELNFTPGTARIYSNSNYILLAKIIEEAGKIDFHEFTATIFEELQMHQTFFQKNYMIVKRGKAYPYADWGDGVWKEYPMMTSLYADGFLYTSLQDQMEYERQVQEGENSILAMSQESVPGAEIKSYGFGLELGEWNRYRAVHHSGSTGSSHAQTLRFPEHKLSIVVMSNNGTLWSGFIAGKAANLLLPEKKEKVKDDYFPKSKLRKEMTLEEISGEYLSTENKIIQVFIREGQLVWRYGSSWPSVLDREGPAIFSQSEFIDSKIVFDKKGFTVYEPNVEKRHYEKMNPFVSDEKYLKGITGTYYSQELNVSLELKLKNDNTLYLLTRGKRGESSVEVIQRDHLLGGDYILKVKRNGLNEVSGILLTYNRLVDIKFIRKN